MIINFFFLPLFIFTYTLNSYSADLSEIDSFLGENLFQSAFKSGDQVHIEFKSCVFGNICDQYINVYQVDEITDSEVKVGIYNKFTKKTGSFTIKKSDWELHSGNRVRMVIHELEQFGFQVQELKMSKIQKKIQIGPILEEHEGYEVKLKAANTAQQFAHFQLEVFRLPGIAQLLLKEKKSNAGLESQRVLLIHSATTVFPSKESQ